MVPSNSNNTERIIKLEEWAHAHELACVERQRQFEESQRSFEAKVVEVAGKLNSIALEQKIDVADIRKAATSMDRTQTRAVILLLLAVVAWFLVESPPWAA